MTKRIEATILLPLALLPGVAGAQTLQFKPSLHLAQTYDANVYRAPSQPQPGNSPKVADRITTLGAGARLTLRKSLQELEVQGEVDHDSYADLGILDNTRYSVDAQARLALGSRFKLKLDANREHRLESFIYRDNTQKGFITTDQAAAKLSYAIAARVSLNAQASRYTTDASLPSSSNYNLAENAAELGADYQRDGYSSIGLAVRLAEGDYPNRSAVPGTGQEKAYHQNSIFVRAGYTPSGLSDFKGQLGYTERTHSDASVSDFQGITGRASYSRKISGKTQVTADLYRDLYYIQDVSANYVENLGLRLALDYRYSAKLAFAIAAEQYQSRYLGTQRIATAANTRQDDITGIKAGVDYRPFYRFSVQPQYRLEKRSSNLDIQRYTDNIFSIDLSYDYGSARRQ